MSLISRGSDAHPIQHVGAWAGMIGPSLFVAVFSIDGWLRPGYDSYRNYVSELALGSSGWIQRVNFIVLGILFLLFTKAVARTFTDGKASRAGPLMFAIVGVSLVVSGPFVTDPMAMLGRQTSWHGIVHGICGALVFSLAPVTCFVFVRRFRVDPTWTTFRSSTLGAGGVIVVAVALMKAGQAPESPIHGFVGLVQRVALVTFLGWIFAFARRLRRAGSHQSSAAPVIL